MLNDAFFIREVFNLAKKGEGFTSPNPIVGAVIVKNGRVISRGYHSKAGTAHAEIRAINKAKGSLRGATLYLNLEPCCHWGKTPPCVDKIIESGIKRVVIATSDPNPEVRGRSIKKLRKSGIEVKVGVMKKEAQRLNEVFFKNVEARLPFVAVKVAQSLDGKIATKTGESKWITHTQSRNFSKKLRDKYDAVLVGVNTIIKDNPFLNGIKKEPYKIVIDPEGRIPLNSNILKGEKDKIIIFSSEEGVKGRERKLNSIKRKVHTYFLEYKRGYFNLKELVKILFKRGITSIFVEGGSFTTGGFFDQHLVDKIYFFFAPKIIGGNTALASIGGEGVSRLKEAYEVKDLEIKRLGRDFLIIGYPCFT